MRIARLKTESREERYNHRLYGIQGWGERNDFPQRVAEIVEGSVTGNACVETYGKFISGRGFAEESFYTTTINETGATIDDLLREVAKDKAMFGGFAIHVNYNALGEVVSASHVPFEWVRFEALNDQHEWNRVALHPDWGGRCRNLFSFNKDDVEFYNRFNPEPSVIADEVELAGGWENYKGQILIVSNNGPKTYPTPIFKAALVDMNIEQGLSVITLRNTRSNFLPAGMLIDKDNAANSEEQFEEKRRELAAFQGDENAALMMYMNASDGDQVPEFVPFKANNYDKDFENAESKTPQIIGRAFTQPPILRAEDVGSNFGADAMRNAYDFYNSITETERQEVSGAFQLIFSHWHDSNINPEGNYEILPKEYQVTRSLAEKLGANVDKVLDILNNTTMSENVKNVLLSKIYGIEDADINDLLAAYAGVVTPQNP